jgi:predicted CopG family antitoxin
MANITLSVPDDLHRKMKKYSEIRWSEVARKAIQKKVRDLEMLDKLTSKSELTEEDAREISELINKSLAKKILS